MGFTKKKNEKRGKTSLSYTKDYKNKTRKNVKGGMLPIILIENAPLIISGVGAVFNLFINWVVTANKTIDNYKAVQKFRSTVLVKKPPPIVVKPIVVPIIKPETKTVVNKPIVKPVAVVKPPVK
jgi:hypothetical protein